MQAGSSWCIWGVVCAVCGCRFQISNISALHPRWACHWYHPDVLALFLFPLLNLSIKVIHLFRSLARSLFAAPHNHLLSICISRYSSCSNASLPWFVSLSWVRAYCKIITSLCLIKLNEEWWSATGNFQKVVKSLIDKLPYSNDTRTFLLQQYAFHVLVKDGFVFVAMVRSARIQICCIMRESTYFTPLCCMKLWVAESFRHDCSTSQNFDRESCWRPPEIRLSFLILVLPPCLTSHFQVDKKLRCPETMPFTFLDTISSHLFAVKTAVHISNTNLGLSTHKITNLLIDRTRTHAILYA